MNEEIRSERLKGLREDRDLLQKDIAKFLDVTQVAYSCYEIGRRQIPLDALVKLAKYYNVSVDYILGLTDERKPYPKSILDNKRS